MNRRDFLRLAGLIATGATLASCSPLYTQLGSSGAETVTGGLIHPQDFLALKRLTYGPTRYERDQVATQGLDAWIEDQLSPAGLVNSELDRRLRQYDFLAYDADALSIWEREDLVSRFKQATLLRKILSRQQIYEMIVEFWTDYFNITIAKGDGWFLKVVDDREVIRTHALGNFNELLLASAHSPAMLVYLDNQANHKDAPNENYARELLELHTLGVDSGYTQADVMALARCLTGWSVKEHFWRGQFKYNADAHDPGRKMVLGQDVEPAGVYEAERVLSRLARHPATAHHLSTRLCRRFLTDYPLKNHRAIVERAAKAFQQTQGNILAVLRVILLDGLFEEKNRPEPKFRRPLDFMAASLRAVGSATDGGPPLQEYLAKMGGALYEWPTPDGPPDDRDAWISNLVPRWQFALALARNELPGTRTDLAALFPEETAGSLDKMFDSLCITLFGSKIEAGMRNRTLSALAQDRQADNSDTPAALLAGLLASPAFQWR